MSSSNAEPPDLKEILILLILMSLNRGYTIVYNFHDFLAHRIQQPITKLLVIPIFFTNPFVFDKKTITNKQTRLVKLVFIGQKFKFVVSELVVGYGE